jgi:hypothetical protein
MQERRIHPATPPITAVPTPVSHRTVAISMTACGQSSIMDSEKLVALRREHQKLSADLAAMTKPDGDFKLTPKEADQLEALLDGIERLICNMEEGAGPTLH